jgi:hypothetical protein
VVANLFGRTPPEAVEIYWVDAAPLPSMKRLFPSLDGATVAVKKERTFVLNCDYWVMLPPSQITTLAPNFPVGRILALAGMSEELDSLRALHLAQSYPWDEIDLDLQLMEQAARDLIRRDREVADLGAKNLGYGSAADLLMSSDR